MVQADNGYMTSMYVLVVSAVESDHVRMVRAAWESNQVRYAFMGTAGILYYADTTQAGRRHMRQMYVSLVSAVDNDHVTIITAEGESNKVNHVVMGAAGMLYNANMVQAGHRYMP